MKSLAGLLWICSSCLCYGQIDVFYTGRMLGYFRMPDQQEFSRKECPSNDEMNPAAKGLYSVWMKRKSTNPKSLLVGMGDNFAPDFFARTFTGTSPDNSPVPSPDKDRYVWDSKQKKWLGDLPGKLPGKKPSKLPPEADKEVPMDNVGCFVRTMGYTALVPGKHDFYFGSNRLREIAKFLSLKGTGTAMLAGNLSVITTVPEARPRLALYEVEHELMEEQKGNAEKYSVLPLVHADDASPGVKFPDVALPSYRKFAVDNAYFLMKGNVREIVTDRTDQMVLKRVDTSTAALLTPPTDAIVAKPDAPLYFYDETSKKLDPESRTVQLRIDGLQICENRTDTVGRKPTCWTIPPADSAEDDDYKTGRLTFEAKYEFLDADRNYAACLHVFRKQSTEKPKYDYYCQPFYVAKPFFFDEDEMPPTGPRPVRDPYQFGAPSMNAEPPPNDRAAGPRLDDPFVVRDILDAQGQTVKVAVFGLLDPDMQGNIGRLDYSWWNSDTKYETAAQISSLTDALSQAMMRCELRNECKDESTRKILLAQMSAAKATQLLVPIKKPAFDLVVTETDSNNKTLDGEVIRTLDVGKSPKFIVVPDQIYSPTLNTPGDAVPPAPAPDPYSPGTLSFVIQRATIYYPTLPAPEPKPKGLRTWILSNRFSSLSTDWLNIKPNPRTFGLPQITASANCPDQGKLKAKALETLRKLGVRNINGAMENWSSAQVLQRLALLVMQHDPKHQADVSLMQSRDLFRPEIYGQAPVTNCNLQELLDRLFWKGDYAVAVSVTGATLTSMLKASDTFTTLEANPTNIDIEKGRSLLTLGVVKDGADQNLTVNGAIVDPARAYAVAMTDYLALADTGYTDLKTPLVPYPYRIKDFQKLDSISAMVCRAIKSSILKDAQCYRAEVQATDHLDPSDSLPPDQTPGLTAAHQTISYLAPTSRWSRYKTFYNGQNAAELTSAGKHFWSFELEKSDFGLNFARPASATALKAEFTGITTAPVTAPITYAVTFDDRARLKFSTAMLDFFFQQESAYGYTRTGGSSFTRNLSANTLAGETGLLGHASWWPIHGRRPREIDLLASFRLETEVQAPRQDIALSTTPPSTLLGTLRRPVDVFGKVGIRTSDERSWIEAGYMVGRSLVNPTAVVFNNGTPAILLIPGSSALVKQTDSNGKVLVDANGNTLYCRPDTTPATATAACPAVTTIAPFSTWVNYYSSPSVGLLTPENKFYATYTGRPISGLFLNFSLNVPLPFGTQYADWAGAKPIALLVENTGKWLFDDHNDLATQTKYYDKLAWSIVLPAVGNLSFKPEVDLLYFRNKSQNLPGQQTSFSFHSTTYIGTFSYTFSWRQGQPLNRVWRYASPAPASTVPASGR